MKYGHFSESGREYIITRPDTPRPWINYLSNGRYCALCSHTGGGHSFYETSGYNRISREYPPQVVLQDRPGRYIYIRDKASGSYWSATWQPICTEGGEFQAKQAVGYTEVKYQYSDIQSTVTYFVPPRDDVEVWMVRLRNTGDSSRDLQAFPFVEWDLANYSFNLTEAEFSKLFNETLVEDEIIFAGSRFWNITAPGAGNPNARWDKFAFMASSLPLAAYDCAMESFIGTYRDYHNPVAVERGQLSNSQGSGKVIVGAMQHDIHLAPGEEITFVITIGVVYHKEDAKTIKARYDEWEEAERAVNEVCGFWDGYLSRTTCETPDDDFNLSFNIWNKYQSWMTSRWSRMDSYFVGGGSLIGHRDSWQDVLAVLPNDLEWSRSRIIYLLEHQFQDGSTLHNWDPLTNIGTKTGHSDDPMWLVLGVIEYLKESGDLVFLDEPVRYYDTGAETVRQHMYKAIDYTLAHMSDRGIPLLMAADWNDGLDYVGRQGRGETTMVAGHLAWMLREVAQLLWFTGNDELAQRYVDERGKLIRAINEYLWDGEWYIRGTRDDGEAFGSSRNIEGRIYLNAQSWLVMAGAAPRNRGIIAMDSVRKHLLTDYGPALFLPAYSEPDPKLGIISRFAPGTKENGTIFCHPVAWAIMAECILGRAEEAYATWSMTSFMKRGKEPEIYMAEPYVYSEYVHGPDSSSFGRGEFSWMTGTAAWMWKVSLEWIMGIRPELRGLLIDPCIPSEWDGFKVTRKFRRATYEIEVSNPEHVSTGVTEILVDGEPCECYLIPTFNDGKTHKVEVKMGTKTEGIEIPAELVAQRVRD